jgi:hypothetical protein
VSSFENRRPGIRPAGCCVLSVAMHLPARLPSRAHELIAGFRSGPTRVFDVPAHRLKIGAHQWRLDCRFWQEPGVREKADGRNAAAIPDQQARDPYERPHGASDDPAGAGGGHDGSVARGPSRISTTAGGRGEPRRASATDPGDAALDYERTVDDGAAVRWSDGVGRIVPHPARPAGFLVAPVAAWTAATSPARKSHSRRHHSSRTSLRIADCMPRIADCTASKQTTEYSAMMVPPSTACISSAVTSRIPGQVRRHWESPFVVGDCVTGVTCSC